MFNHKNHNKMRKFLPVLAALFFVACAEDPISDGIAQLGNDEFEVTTEGNDLTRTYVDSNNKVQWSAGDEVGVHFSTSDYQSRPITMVNDSFHKISGFRIPATTDLSKYYAVYPAQEGTTITTDGHLTYTLPAMQTATDQSFGEEANVMVAATQNTADRSLHFKNVMGYLRFKLYWDEAQPMSNIRKVVLKGNNNEPLAGLATITYGNEPSVVVDAAGATEVTLDCGTNGMAFSQDPAKPTILWFALPPVTLSKGITLTITDVEGKVATISNGKSLVIARSQASTKSNLNAQTYATPIPTGVYLATGTRRTYGSATTNDGNDGSGYVVGHGLPKYTATPNKTTFKDVEKTVSLPDPYDPHVIRLSNFAGFAGSKTGELGIYMRFSKTPENGRLYVTDYWGTQNIAFTNAAMMDIIDYDGKRSYYDIESGELHLFYARAGHRVSGSVVNMERNMIKYVDTSEEVLVMKTPETPKIAPRMTLRVISLNSKNDAYSSKKVGLKGLINTEKPAVMGTQEMYAANLDDLVGGCPGYAWSGEQRGGSILENPLEHNAIIYNTNVLDKLDEGTFWLTETPNKASKLQNYDLTSIYYTNGVQNKDANGTIYAKETEGTIGGNYAGLTSNYTRICSWCKFRHKASGQEFYFFNTHLDNVNKVANAKSAMVRLAQTKFLLKFIVEKNTEDLPVFLTGDFNENAPGSGTATFYTALTWPSNTHYIAKGFSEMLGLTEGYFDRVNITTYSMNKSAAKFTHIFYHGPVTTDSFGWIVGTYGSSNIGASADAADISGTLSDHFPEYALFKMY